MHEKKSADTNVENNVKKISIFALLLIFSLTILSLFVLPQLKTQYSLKQFLPHDNPRLQRDEHTRQVFQLSEAQPFIITAKLSGNSETWFKKESIEMPLKWRELFDAFEK